MKTKWRMPVGMTKFYSIFLLVMFLIMGMGGATQAKDQRLSVVELFTSQGCSSCPPADAFLGELAMRSDVLALAYHVDYWDYIGWADVFAKSTFTTRQRHYARAFNLRYIYTPQMVVSGNFENSGNERRTIIKALEKDLQEKHKIIFSQDNNGIHLQGHINNKQATVFGVSFHKEVKTKVRRGENRGKTLTNYHVVKDLEILGSWTGESTYFPLPPHSLDSAVGHAVFIQLKDSLKILGAFIVK